MRAEIEDVRLSINEDDLSSIVRQANEELDIERATSLFQLHNIDQTPHDSLNTLPRHEEFEPDHNGSDSNNALEVGSRVEMYL